MLPAINAALESFGDAPNGGNTTVWFQWGLTASYGSNTAAVVVGATNPAATLAFAYATNLSPSTLYHFQAVATNSAGTAYGGDQTFTTAAFAPFILVNTSFTPVENGSVAWGDYDNDGLPDILLAGNSYGLD